jgi:hypothetical protein
LPQGSPKKIQFEPLLPDLALKVPDALARRTEFVTSTCRGLAARSH